MVAVHLRPHFLLTPVLRLTALLLLTCALPLGAQELLTPASELSAYVRLLELQGKAKDTPLVYWSASTEPRRNGLALDSTHLWASRYSLGARSVKPAKPEFRLLETRADLLFNSSFPRVENDGALWAGRGISGTVRAGAEVRWRWFTARLAPTFGYSQNREFVLGSGPGNDSSAFAYPWAKDIDFPQRFGTEPISFADWGQSAARLDIGAFTAGFSTENVWWGPAYRNAIVLGSAAGGFPHFDLGLGRPVETPIGAIEMRALWGQLSASKYSDDNGARTRILTGLTIGYRPRFLPGLTLGLTRAVYEYWPDGGIGAGDIFEAFGGIFNNGRQAEPGGPVINNLNDQLASLTARWLLPESGAEFYAEFARNDFAGGITDLVLEPDHARAFTLGFQKTLPVSTGALVLKGEHTTLGQPATKNLRQGAPFYVHGIVTEGYTHRGQPLGASIGPGSNAQYLGLDRYTAQGRIGLFLERVRYDDDYAFSALRDSSNAHMLHQTDLTAGASIQRFARAFDWGATLGMTRQLNRYFMRENNVTNWLLRFNLARGTRVAPANR